jgi:hypothetical protein
MFRTLAGLGEIAVGAFDQRTFVAVRKLTRQRIISCLVSLVGLKRTFSTVGIIAKMITRAACHKKDLSNCAYKQMANPNL